MKPDRVGRLIGIGTRVAAGKLREGTVRAAAAAERAGAERANSGTSASGGGVSAGRPVTQTRTEGGSAGAVRAAMPSSDALAEGSRRFARGAGRFSATLWKPFAHATGQLTLQITGLLFAFFALGFAAKSWQLYQTAGWRDRHLGIFVAFAALFTWFAVSSFWRARRRRRQG
jgi:hypothetical protein